MLKEGGAVITIPILSRGHWVWTFSALWVLLCQGLAKAPCTWYWVGGRKAKGSGGLVPERENSAVTILGIEASSTLGLSFRHLYNGANESASLPPHHLLYDSLLV